MPPLLAPTAVPVMRRAVRVAPTSRVYVCGCPVCVRACALVDVGLNSGSRVLPDLLRVCARAFVRVMPWLSATTAVADPRRQHRAHVCGVAAPPGAGGPR